MRTASFRATIRRIGTKAVIDIPARVSEAFSGHAHSGRVAVEGTLGGAPLRATLMPVAGGRHRLFVNEAMRRAAGAEAGDTIGILIRPAAGSKPAARPGASKRAGPATRSKPAGKSGPARKPAAPRKAKKKTSPAEGKPARGKKRRTSRRHPRKKKS